MVADPRRHVGRERADGVGTTRGLSPQGHEGVQNPHHVDRPSTPTTKTRCCSSRRPLTRTPPSAKAFSHGTRQGPMPNGRRSFPKSCSASLSLAFRTCTREPSRSRCPWLILTTDAPVDYADLAARLTRLTGRAKPRTLGDEKLLVTARTLAVRRSQPEAFIGERAGYHPLASSSGPRDRVCQVCRRRRSRRDDRHARRRRARTPGRLARSQRAAAPGLLERRADRNARRGWHGRHRDRVASPARCVVGEAVRADVWAPFAHDLACRTGGQDVSDVARRRRLVARSVRR